MVGVGGQGIILASDILSEVALLSNYDVKKNEIHGMSQRGGAVVSHIRIGNKVYAPIISEGAADFIISFEKMEFLRYMEYINNRTMLLLNTQVIYPLSVTSGKAAYPNSLIEDGIKRFTKAYQFDALELALSIGNPRVISSIILGALSVFLPFSYSIWENTIINRVPKNTSSLNIKGFNKGREITKNP
jgi:indolepyruvate ferredoxin oxidoreductase beta subunit